MLVWPQTVENRAALRTAFAALAAVLISFKFHLETPFWSGMTVVVVSNLYTGNIINKAMLRIIGTVAGAFLGFYTAGLVVNSYFLYFLSCFSIVFIGAYYYSFSANGYGYLLGSICAFLIISQVAMNPQNAFFVAIWRPVEIGIGVLVSALSAYFIFPNHLKNNITFQLHEIFTDFSDEFTQLNMLCKAKPDLDVLAQNNLKIKKKIRKAVELIGAMNHELGVSKSRIDQVRALLDIFYDCSRQVHYLLLISPQEIDFKMLQSLPIHQVLHAIREDLLQLQTAFFKQADILSELKTKDLLVGLEHHVIQMQKDDSVSGSHLYLEANTDMQKEQSVFKSNFAYAFIHFLHHVNQNLLLMRSLLSNIPLEMTAKFQILSTRERIRTDSDVIKRSIKAGLSVIVALGFWMVSNWPGGINGIISSLVISIRKNLFEMKSVSIHRLLGCILGGGIALFPLFFLEMNLFDFIVIFFLSIWGFSYFMFKSPQYSYIGLQANIAVIISLAQKGGPPVYLGPPLQRLAGIVIGIAASFLVANLIWRSDVWTMLNRYLQKIYTYMGENLQQILLTRGDQKKLHDLGNLFWNSRGLLESLADDPLSPKKQILLNELRNRFDSLVMIQATMSHILGAINREKVAETAQILGCDLGFYEREIWRVFNQRDSAYGLKLSQQLQEVLSKTTKKPGFFQISTPDARGFFAYINALNQLVLRIH
ncbi:FUSC family protein [Fluoribacter dumoffii]|uniref:p-hydroxybenzoic acid efflux pump subunit AaeB n=1 Tax=Fluoribacter dumoffii TaxID=463 RepID=A0A377GAI9_9GAMM|nr:FUSC family protein [Fluoribacter dumoffii]KTC88719.1 p-hydroxybenzoic acid efflux pump subunit AaeB [Fluoribacter dumoffii NY 23]MCW8385988.1 FUSC family protein [Fluoribacter dumoffii]MCW8419040.1 FUSC family protein [Fluoribacter dumoffii]MCW8453116.1 FUSC family protein [Fluoribacter dumoffii]MCW8459666.1 FUSC family protein [Fluoribacter dumoffii]